jgi:hypothetical protein
MLRRNLGRLVRALGPVRSMSERGSTFMTTPSPVVVFLDPAVAAYVVHVTWLPCTNLFEPIWSAREHAVAPGGCLHDDQARSGPRPDCSMCKHTALPARPNRTARRCSCGYYNRHMSTYLQVLVEEQELADLEAAARRQEMTLSEWVRRALGIARRQEPGSPAPEKLAVIRAAVQHDFPTADIDQM